MGSQGLKLELVQRVRNCIEIPRESSGVQSEAPALLGDDACNEGWMTITMLCALCVSGDVTEKNYIVLFDAAHSDIRRCHQSRCNPLLHEIPDGEWLCPGCKFLALTIHLEPRVVCSARAISFPIPLQAAARTLERVLPQVPAEALLRIVILAPTIAANQTLLRLFLPRIVIETQSKLDFPLYGNGRPWQGVVTQNNRK